MNCLIKPVFLTIIFHILKSVICDRSDVLCKRILIDSNNKVINEKTDCKPKPCIISLSKQNEVYINSSYSTNIRNVPDLDLSSFQYVNKYNDVGELEKTNKTIWDAFKIVRYKNRTPLRNTSCVKSTKFLPINGIDHLPHFLEDGSFVIEELNKETRYGPSYADYVFWFSKLENTSKVIVHIKEILTNSTSMESGQNERLTLLYAIGMFISSFFMILVLVVYATVENLQNLVRLILMAFVGTLTCSFLFKASRSLGLRYMTITPLQCTIISPMTNFMQVSSFTWMNVLSFDIWWTFRGTYYKRSEINRRGKWNKFKRYAVFAWGPPLLLTIAEVVIDNLNLRDYPNFVKPDFSNCTFSASKWYLLAPITAILAVNCVLFTLTVYNIRRTRKEMSRFNKEETKKNKESENAFVLYLKLSMLTGLNWIFDVLSTFEVLPDWFQIAANIYNAFTGVVIFLAFTFKTRFLLELCRTCKIENGFTTILENRLNRNTTFKSSSSKAKPTENLALSVPTSEFQEIELGAVSKIK